LPPILAINFERPKSKSLTLPKFKFFGWLMSFLYLLSFSAILAGVLINIECKAWAHNIVHDRADRRGSVHFELMVD
jgi:hypothetical protein